MRIFCSLILSLGALMATGMIGVSASASAVPVVLISSPLNGATVSGTLPIVTQIIQPPVIWENFYIDGRKIASSPPYTVNWDASSAGAGSHTIEVVGFAPDGSVVGTATAAVAVNVSGTPSAYFGSLAPHATLPSETKCAQEIKPSTWEPRPENHAANQTIPSALDLVAFHAAPLNFVDGPPASDFQAVDGNYTGTTDMILQWAACKWGMDENIMRAQAYQESWWSAYTTGDLRVDPGECQAGQWDGWQTVEGYCYQSYGLLQLKMASYNAWPMAWDSTAFNADFRGAYWRACMNGDVQYYYGSIPVAGYPAYPGGTTTQMAWGCVGSWYSGSWYDSAALGYIATVKNEVATKPWQNLPAKSSASLSIHEPADGTTVSGVVQIGIQLNQGDPQACYACWSIDGVHQGCTPAAGPFAWDTSYHVLNGHHAIQVDSYTCSGAGPNHHASVDVDVSN